MKISQQIFETCLNLVIHQNEQHVCVCCCQRHLLEHCVEMLKVWISNLQYVSEM